MDGRLYAAAIRRPRSVNDPAQREGVSRWQQYWYSLLWAERRVRETMPRLQPTDYTAVRGWAKLEILATQAFAILRYATVTNQEGEPRRLLGEYRLLRHTQNGIAASLGMTLASRRHSRDRPAMLR